jgi:Ubiquitin family
VTRAGTALERQLSEILAASRVFLPKIALGAAEDTTLDMEHLQGFRRITPLRSVFVLRRTQAEMAADAYGNAYLGTADDGRSFLKMQNDLFSALAQIGLNVMKGLGSQGEALALEAAKGLEARSGGGVDGESSISSLTVHRTKLVEGPSVPAGAVPHHIDCSLLTVMAIPIGDTALKLLDCSEGSLVTPGTLLAASATSKWMVVILTGHLFDVAFGAGDDALAVPYQEDALGRGNSAASSSVSSPGSATSSSSSEGQQQLSGSKRSRKEMEADSAPATNDRITFILRLLPARDSILKRFRSLSSPIPSYLRCSDIVRCFRSGRESITFPHQATLGVVHPKEAKSGEYFIFVRMRTQNEPVVLYCSYEDSILRLKERLSERERIPTRQIILTSCLGKILEDNYHLWTYNLQKGTTVNMRVRGSGGDPADSGKASLAPADADATAAAQKQEVPIPSNSVLIRDSWGRSFPVHAMADHSVERLRASILDEESYKTMRLFYLGRELENGYTLADYGICQGSTIRLLSGFKGD